jgi:hypothetical protein
MNDIVFNSFEFKDNLFTKLNTEITKSNQQISYIANGGVNRGESYRNAISKFTSNLSHGLDENTEYNWNEILYVTNELSTSQYMFSNLMEYDEFESFILMIKKYNKLSIYKKLFKIYFNYYNTLNTEGSMPLFKMYLKSILRNYNGNNKYLKTLISLKDYIFDDLIILLDKYNNGFELLKQDLKLEESYEFTKAILNLKIIQELKLLEYDESKEEVFSTIIHSQDMFFTDGFTLKEYVAKYLIERSIEEEKPFPNWQLFILKLMGDPRSTGIYATAMGSWNIIGTDLKDFFIKTLSQDDLKLFLEVLSDSVSDTNYHYRKAFWMQFLDKVIFTKIIMGSDAFNNISDSLHKNFDLNNESYAKLTGNHSQSAIYIDFGNIKVIEFTHNGSLRFFTDCPINLQQNKFSLTQMTPIKYIKKRLAHSGAKTYNWQQYALNIMNEEIHTNLNIEDIYIEEDRQKIYNYSKKNPQIINNSNSSNIVSVNTKICKKCNKTKNTNQFFKSKKAEYGYGYWCKECLSNKHK